MEWDTRVGAYAKNLQDIAERTGKVPPMLAEKPDLPDEYFGVVDAFVLLSQGRPLEGGVEGMIPLRDIQAYMEIFGIDDLDERGELVTLIRRMDLAYVSEKLAKRSKK